MKHGVKSSSTRGTEDHLPTIGLVLGSNFESGGAYNYEISLLQILDAHKEFHIVIYSLFEIDEKKFRPRSTSRTYRMSLKDRLIRQVISFFSYPPKILSSGLFASSLERQMERDGISIAYFLSPNPAASIFQTIPMINTVWDVGHKDLLEFPEVRSLHIYRNRETYLSEVLPRSLHIFTDSQLTKENIIKYYKVSPYRITPIGLFPMVASNLPKDGSIEKKDVVIYPANFWPHKNHDLLFKAMEIVLNRKTCKLILTASSTEQSRDVLKELEKKFPKVKYEMRGGVPKKELEFLIRESKVLVMPSSLGPTNLPPLEALMLGTKVVISNAHETDTFLGDPNVFIVDPYNSEAFAAAILEVLENSTFIEADYGMDKNRDALISALRDLFERIR